MTSQPWMKFYPSDWRSDPRLRMCSLAARGLWMEMLMLMHEAVPYGHLLVAGIAPTPQQLAVLAGASADEVPTLLAELEAAAVFSRTGRGVIYSRRMTRDEKKAKKAREIGKKGGNPTLCKKTENPPPDNPPVNGHVNGEDKTQIPDTRIQTPESYGGGGSARAPEGVQEVGEEVSRRSGIPIDNRFNWPEIRRWLEAGYDPEADIYPVVSAEVDRSRERIATVQYFAAPIDRHHTHRTAPPVKAATNVHPIRPASGQRRQSAGRAAWRNQSLAYIARILEEGD